MITILYEIDEQCQKALLAAGEPAGSRRTLFVEKSDQVFPGLLARARVDADGEAVLDLCPPALRRLSGIATPADILTAVQAKEIEREGWKARERAEREAYRERRVTEALDKGPTAHIDIHGRYEEIEADPRLEEQQARAREIIAEREAAREAAREAREAIEAAEEAAREEAEAAEKRDWIDRHGSPRLCMMVAEGIEHMATYRDERLAKDRPGWLWARSVDGEDKDPRNPPAQAFTTLARARLMDPAAQLRYWTVDHECVGDCECECPTYDSTEYVAMADFLGREIILREGDA